MRKSGFALALFVCLVGSSTCGNADEGDGGTGGVGFVLRIEDEFGIEFGRILGDGTTALTYLELPLTFAGYLDAGQNAYLRGYLGISPNVLLSAKFTGTLEGSSADEDIKDVLKGFDFAWAIGASATLDDSGRDYDVQTNAFEMALGVGIPLVRTVGAE